MRTLNNSTEMDVDEGVKEYMENLWTASVQLATTPEHDTRIEHPRPYTVQEFPIEIARKLLQASQLTVLTCGITNLPPLSFSNDCEFDPIPEDSPPCETEYRRRRIDYLRLLLRAMGPTSMQIAAYVGQLVTEEVKWQPAAFVLLSVWLPVAPHISDLALRIFPHFHCPLLVAKSDLVRWHLAEATHAICHFFGQKRLEPGIWKDWWDWSPLMEWLPREDEDVTSLPGQATRWHTIRAVGWIMEWSPATRAAFCSANKSISTETLPWLIHPWEIDREEFLFQKHWYYHQRTYVWNESLNIPTSEHVQGILPIHPWLASFPGGLLFWKKATNCQPSPCNLVQCSTTTENLFRLGLALANSDRRPVLVHGPPGSGKSRLIRHCAALMNTEVLELHIDDETDTKTLVGTYTATDIPGNFEWRPGALTRAVRDGSWVLIENVDTIPIEIQASLVGLLKDRLLNTGRSVEICHPQFRLFGTMSKTTGQAQRILSPTLWQNIEFREFRVEELKEISMGLHPAVPGFIVDAVINIFVGLTSESRSRYGRNASIRDLFKLLARISKTCEFSKSSYATEHMRTLCFAETYDVFAGACPDTFVRRELSQRFSYDGWGIDAQSAFQYVESRSPSMQLHPSYTEIGRARIPVSEVQAMQRITSDSFAITGYSLRLMESIAVCIRQAEPVLLVGETGVGKTRILQHMANLAGRRLVVQNLSLQTDSTDLLGGYKPLELKQVARHVYQAFIDIFTSTFSRRQNADFLSYCATAFEQKQWKKLSLCFRRAAQRGLDKMKTEDESSTDAAWIAFKETADRFEQQRLACDSGLAFIFSEGALVDAIRKGYWVLLDEINLASLETLQRLYGLLDDSQSSLTLTERGDAQALRRHDDFRLFAAMNPATDSGKKDLHSSMRSRFTEMYVDEMLNPIELRLVVSAYLAGVLPIGDKSPEHTIIVMETIDAYLKCRKLAEGALVDGNGQKPRYTLRSLTRALTASKALHVDQKFPLRRALAEGFNLAFQGLLETRSVELLRKTVHEYLLRNMDTTGIDGEQPGRRPGGKNGSQYVLIKPFWIKAGPLEPVDWSEIIVNARRRFIQTTSTKSNLKRLALAVSSGPWPILLEGPTSAGKTTMVEYLAARCGHRIIRINNHEHTDIQEYTGGFTADSRGALVFQDGLLVQALKQGDWVILDELNLAPSEVLEALNRLLDDNRELYLPEINETIRAHPNFRLFATQNPCGVYGGRKPLSRAFRNRFVELHISDIPSNEMVSILELRCGCPTSYATKLVTVMDSLRQRRSKSGFFLGKDGLVTPRDLLRWAERDTSSKLEIAQAGFMLLAERLRDDEEKNFVKMEIQQHLKVTLDIDDFYYGETSEARMMLADAKKKAEYSSSGPAIKSLAPTRSILRLVSLVLQSARNREPILLVGGKLVKSPFRDRRIPYEFSATIVRHRMW